MLELTICLAMTVSPEVSRSKRFVQRNNERLSLFLIVPGKRIGERIVIVVHGRMDRHPGRFVDNENIFVFIDDSKRQLGGRCLSEDSVS